MLSATQDLQSLLTVGIVRRTNVPSEWSIGEHHITYVSDDISSGNDSIEIDQTIHVTTDIAKIRIGFVESVRKIIMTPVGTDTDGEWNHILTSENISSDDAIVYLRKSTTTEHRIVPDEPVQSLWSEGRIISKPKIGDILEVPYKCIVGTYEVHGVRRLEFIKPPEIEANGGINGQLVDGVPSILELDSSEQLEYDQEEHEPPGDKVVWVYPGSTFTFVSPAPILGNKTSVTTDVDGNERSSSQELTYEMIVINNHDAYLMGMDDVDFKPFTRTVRYVPRSFEEAWETTSNGDVTLNGFSDTHMVVPNQTPMFHSTDVGTSKIVHDEIYLRSLTDGTHERYVTGIELEKIPEHVQFESSVSLRLPMDLLPFESIEGSTSGGGQIRMDEEWDNRRSMIQDLRNRLNTYLQVKDTEKDTLWQWTVERYLRHPFNEISRSSSYLLPTAILKDFESFLDQFDVEHTSKKSALVSLSFTGDDCFQSAALYHNPKVLRRHVLVTLGLFAPNCTLSYIDGELQKDEKSWIKDLFGENRSLVATDRLTSSLNDRFTLSPFWPENVPIPSNHSISLFLEDVRSFFTSIITQYGGLDRSLDTIINQSMYQLYTQVFSILGDDTFDLLNVPVLSDFSVDAKYLFLGKLDQKSFENATSMKYANMDASQIDSDHRWSYNEVNNWESSGPIYDRTGWDQEEFYINIGGRG